MFGIFFILAAHEHYSIDVFVAFYITSRLFLYYHTLANNQALMSRDSTRTRIWFPMFSYFESSVDGIIPNEYNTIDEILCQIFSYIFYLKDMCMLTARRIWVLQDETSSNLRLRQNSLIKKVSTNNLDNHDSISIQKVSKSTSDDKISADLDKFAILTNDIQKLNPENTLLNNHLPKKDN